MSTEFDPYHKWLGIPPKLQPPNHYRLLGVEPFESDLDVIEAAANQRMAYLQGLASGEHGELSQTLLNELAMARVCLMDPDEKEAYDAELRQEIEPPEGKTEQAETPTQPAAAVETERGAQGQIERPPTDDAPAPPPVAAAPPVAVPEPDAAPPATRVPPVALPTAQAVAAEGEVTALAEEGTLPSKKPPPVPAKSALKDIAPVVSVPTTKPVAHARQLRRNRNNPVILAAGSAAAILALLAVVYIATGQWKNEPSSEPRTSQGTSTSSRARQGQPKPNQPKRRVKPVDLPSDWPSTGSAKRQEPTGSEFLASPVTDFPVGEPKPLDVEPSQEDVPFAAAERAIKNGNIEAALPLIERVLESPDSQQRTWARQMLEEVDVATSDYTAQQSLEQLSDEQLELFVKGDLKVDAAYFQFSYPALRERFGETLKENAREALERRRENREDLMTAASDRPSDDAAPRVEEPPAKPKKTEVDPPTDPAELLDSRGLRKREEYWLLDGDDQLKESVARVEERERSSRAADTALLNAVDTYRESANQVAMAERTGRIGIIEQAQREFNNMKREYREVVARSMRARSQLTVASLRAAHRAEEALGRYGELADDPDVQWALKELGPETNKLGPTQTFERNLKRAQRNDERLLTDQVMGFFGGEEENVFHVQAILNDRASAQFALRPQAEFSLVPEHVLREAGIPYDREWKLEKKANGVEFRTNRVVIPSLRLGRFVSTDIEAFILPANVRNLSGFLANSAFPNFRINVQPGESVARLRAVD